MIEAPPGREAVSVREGASIAGIGGTLMYQAIREGWGPPVINIGSRRLIRVAALRQWLAELEAQQSGDQRESRSTDEAA